MMMNPLWKRKAMAFAVRSHRHLWGKNNEDPLSFLYIKGICVDLAKSLYLGWNKFGQKRPLAGWGLQGKGDFLIPPGLVFPYIREKELLAILIVSMTSSHDPTLLPGSFTGPFVLGPEGGAPKYTHDLLQGLVLIQENPDTPVTYTLTSSVSNSVAGPGPFAGASD
jgi:hypothetical protein